MGGIVQYGSPKWLLLELTTVYQMLKGLSLENLALGSALAR
jgi:hypothetical protein